MKITRKSPFSGKTNTYDIDVTREQLAEYENGSARMIQDIMPQVNPDAREFIKTGITPSEWPKEDS